jgi:hypothetical protein
MLGSRLSRLEDLRVGDLSGGIACATPINSLLEEVHQLLLRLYGVI